MDKPSSVFKPTVTEKMKKALSRESKRIDEMEHGTVVIVVKDSNPGKIDFHDSILTEFYNKK